MRSPYAAGNVPADADLVVIGNALSRGNPEVEAVLDRRQRYASLPAVLAEEFIRGRTSLVVAGTHGKTTTSSLLAFVLAEAGLDPSFLIGGAPLDFPRSYRDGRGRHFVVEGDEYDCAFFDKRPKFVHYLPDVAVIGNVEYDHADIYPDFGAVKTAFRRLVGVVPGNGLIVAGAESPAVGEVLLGSRSRITTFGVEVAADWRAADVSVGASGTRFRAFHEGRDLGSFDLRLAGAHNVRNALAALAVATECGVPLEAARAALATFRGVRRRLEVRGEVGGVSVLDDFAHHPSAVRETLGAVRAMAQASGGGRVIAVFEPRSYTSRTRVFQADFGRALAVADRVIVAAAHLPAKVPEGERLSEAELVSAARAEGARADVAPAVEDIVALLAREAAAGDRIVVLSNGGFGGIHDKILRALRDQAGTV